MIKTTYPPLPTWPDYTAAVQAYEDLHTDLREAHRVLDDLRGGDRDAAKADTEAQAAALRAGKAQPPAKFMKAWKDDTAAAKDRVRVLEAAVAQQEQAVLALLRSEREQAVQAAQEARADAAAHYRRSLAGLVDAREAFHAATRALGWVVLGGNTRLKTASAPGLTLAAARTMNGEPLPITAVLNALAAEADDSADGAVETRFTPGAAQPPAEAQKIRVSVPDPTGQGPGRVILVDPDDMRAYAQAKAEQSAAMLARDLRENSEAAALAAAQDDRPA